MRFWTLEEVFERWPSLWFRIAFESALPILAALIWGVKAFVAPAGTVFNAITAAGIAFTAVLYVQGQILRMAKNVRDENDAKEFRVSFASIQEGIDQLRKQALSTSVATTVAKTERVEKDPLFGFGQFEEQAKYSIQSGQYYAGALTAAAGFEFAARQVAEQTGWWHHSKLPADQLLYALAEKTGLPRSRDSIRTLTQVRNTLVHANKGTFSIDKAGALELVNAFRRGVHELSIAMD